MTIKTNKPELNDKELNYLLMILEQNMDEGRLFTSLIPYAWSDIEKTEMVEDLYSKLIVLTKTK